MTRRYRLRMSPLQRGLRVAVLALAGAILVTGALMAADLWYWRLLSAVGAVASILAIRAVLGAAVVITADDLIVQPNWPVRRRIRWYRIDHAEVIPGAWTVLLELIDGERFELPCVDAVDELYTDLEHHRSALDQV